MTESVEAPERIWIESEGGCPYFYHEDEISDVGSPVTEYVRADKLRAEIEALRAEVERLRADLMESDEDPTIKESLQLDRPREHISSPDCWCEPFLWYEDDTGNTYTNEAVAEGAAPEGLRPLYDRPKPDDTALLRQALEALEEASDALHKGHPVRMNTQKAIAALRERMGVKA